MSLMRRCDGREMSSVEFMLCGRSRNIAGFVLPEHRFLDTLKILMAFATTFELFYGTSFDDA